MKVLVYLPSIFKLPIKREVKLKEVIFGRSSKTYLYEIKRANVQNLKLFLPKNSSL